MRVERPAAIVVSVPMGVWPALDLRGLLTIPDDPTGLVIFVQGSGSSRMSPRNRSMAKILQHHGQATLLINLLTAVEVTDRANPSTTMLLASRLVRVAEWVRHTPQIRDLPIGYLGAATGSGAAIAAAGMQGDRVSAVVCRGGRPDLAGGLQSKVTAPTLLVVGGADPEILQLNREAQAHLTCVNRLTVVPGATHLFEEPGALDRVAMIAADWFDHGFTTTPRMPSQPVAS